MPIYSIEGPIANEVVIGEAAEGDVVRRLRIKNRKLEQELARLISKREDFYANRVSQADEKWYRVTREKEDADKAWREKHQRSMDETRAGASIMCALFRSQKKRLQEKIRGDRAESERQLAAAREKISQMEAEHASTTQALQQKLQGTIKDYEDKLARQKAEADDKISHLERQLSAAHHETQRLKEADVEARTQIHELQLQLQRRLADMERLEGLVAAPRTMIKEIQNRAQLQKETLEREIADYVRFIVATHRAASEAPARPKTTGAARFVTAARPSTPPTSPQVARPLHLQLPLSARSQLPSALPPLGDDPRSNGKHRTETART